MYHVYVQGELNQSVHGGRIRLIQDLRQELGSSTPTLGSHRLNDFVPSVRGLVWKNLHICAVWVCTESVVYIYTWARSFLDNYWSQTVVPCSAASILQ